MNADDKPKEEIMREIVEGLRARPGETTLLSEKEVEPQIRALRAQLTAGGVEIGAAKACALVHLGVQALLEMGLVRASLVDVLRVAANAEMQRLATREGIEWRALGEGEP